MKKVALFYYRQWASDIYQSVVRQQQRRVDLTQRNQEVRMINASRIVHHGGVMNPAGNPPNDFSGRAAGEQNIHAHNSNTSKEEP